MVYQGKSLFNHLTTGATTNNFRKLSAFKVCEFGEARIWIGAPVQDAYSFLSKSVLFRALPPHLSEFESWMPSFKLMEASGASVQVIFRLKQDAAVRDANEWKKAERGLPQLWARHVLLPAIASLETSRRTRRFNTVETALSTDILPKYVRLYREDLDELDAKLEEATSSSTHFTTLRWFFALYKFGQRFFFCTGDTLGPESFGFGSMFQADRLDSVSVHLALNFSSNEDMYELFWDRLWIKEWTRG